MSTQDNGKFRRKDVCDEKHNGVDARFETDEKEIAQHAKEIRAINLKITSTLVFSIATLLTLVVMLLTGLV